MQKDLTGFLIHPMVVTGENLSGLRKSYSYCLVLIMSQ
jgi:hypothetical protein